MDQTVFDPGAAPSQPASDTLDMRSEPTQPASDTYEMEPTVMDLGSWAPSAEPEAAGEPSPAHMRAGGRASGPSVPPPSAPNDPKRAIRAKPAAVHIALPVGFRLHEYRIDSVLGQGGFGIAYKATDVNLNAKVVIKEYLPEDFAYRTTDSSVCARDDHDQEFYQTGLDSFLVEARTLATFRHPNIVRVARFFEANRTAYMVLEYERGQSLKAWRKKHETVPEAELVNLLAPLFNGLAVVHKSGYLHRDIKPDNIYVRDEDGSLVLLDFGAARQVICFASSSSSRFSAACRPSAPACAPNRRFLNCSTSWGRSFGCMRSAQSIARRNCSLYLPCPRSCALGCGSGSSSRIGASNGFLPVTSQKSVAPMA